jgi:hypothetical protein
MEVTGWLGGTPNQLVTAQITIQFKVTSILPLCNILCHEVDSSIIILKTTEEYLQTGRNRAQ